MTVTVLELAELSGAVLVALGGGGAIVAGLSSWLGKVWAERLMGKERIAHDQALTALRAKLDRDNQQSLEGLRTELDLLKQKHMKGFHDRIATYRLAVDIVAELLADFDQHFHFKQQIAPEKFDAFNRSRLKAYGYMAMLAPQTVMDAHNNLFDHLMLIWGGKAQYEWSIVRSLAIALLNEIRKDLGIDVSPIQYNGKL
ncbi:MAG: hypothetical protein LLG15_03530 [Betaproteobacteria bacterium]|nr:hypothetical protein [Betaproteobacteria bacterium]